MPGSRDKPALVVVCGPTAAGKTAAAIELAERFGGEIVSADSMQVYRFMDIGTAKPTAAEQARVRHHLIDVADPDEPFDAARFSREARAAAFALHRRGVLPVVAGGTGLYIKALLRGIFRADPPDPALRERLRVAAAERGAEHLHRRLTQRDPAAAARIHPNDAFRIIRALETLAATGEPLSAHHRKHAFGEQPFRSLKIGLDVDRAKLYGRIDRRVDRMAAAGLLAEVQSLLARGYSADLKSMQSLGYRHMVDYLAGRLGWQEALDALKRDTRRFAKRQLTWFRADTEIRWNPPEELAARYPEIEDFLN